MKRFVRVTIELLDGELGARLEKGESRWRLVNGGPLIGAARIALEEALANLCNLKSPTCPPRHD